MSSCPAGCLCLRCRPDTLGDRIKELEAELAEERRIKYAIQIQANEELERARRAEERVRLLSRELAARPVLLTPEEVARVAAESEALLTETRKRLDELAERTGTTFVGREEKG